MSKTVLYAREGVAFDHELVVRDTNGAAVDISGWTFALKLQRQAGTIDITLNAATGGAQGLEVVDGPNGVLRMVIDKTTLEGVDDTTGNFTMFGDLLGTPPATAQKMVADVRLNVTTAGFEFSGTTSNVILDAVGAAIFLRAEGEADRAETEADRAALMLDQAADLVLPANTFIDILTTDPLVTALAEGTYFKIVDSTTGIATRYVRTAGGADELTKERTDAWFVMNEGVAVFSGLADDSAVWQAAHDAAESAGVPLHHYPAGSTFNFKSTTYIGNARFVTNRCVWNFVLDNSFTQLGSSARKAAGAMLTKSSASAGFGMSTVSIEYDELNIVATRTSTTSSLKTGLLLSNVDKFAGGDIHCHSKTTVAAGCGALDLWGGCQNVETGAIYYHRENAFELEGFWLRNLSAGRVAKNWTIAGIVLTGIGQDEQCALFTGTGTVANIENVSIGFIRGEIEAGGGGQVFSVIDNNGFSEDRFKNIQIGPITAVVKGVNSSKTDTFAVKFTNCAPRVTSIDIEYNGSWGTVPTVYGLRSVTDSGQTRFPKVGSARVALNYAQENAATVANAISGTFTFDGKTVVDGTGSGWRHGINSIPNVPDAQVSDGKDDATKLFSTNAVNNCDVVKGDVAGVMQNVRYFSGIHRLKFDKWGSKDWFNHVAAFNPRFIAYEGVDVVVTGTPGALGRIFACASTGPKDIAIRLDYTLDMPSGFTVTKPGMGAVGKLTKARYSRRVGNTVTAIKKVDYATGGTLTLASDTIAPTAQIHRVDTEGAAATDNLTTISGGEFEGETLWLWGTDAGRVVTVKHNLGNIQTRTGADVALSTTGPLQLIYSNVTNKWHADV